MKTYDYIRAFIAGSLWPILPAKMDAMLAVIKSHAAGFRIDEAAAEKLTAANRSNQTAKTTHNVAVLPIVGVLSQRMNLMTAVSGGMSTERLGREFDALVVDGSVDAIVLDVDSPGGNYYGTPELASKVLAARGSKPIVAVANSLMASAAYWIASAADEVVITPSGDVGSIGVLAIHTDFSEANEKLGIKPTYISYGRHKAESNPDTPLSSDAAEELQRQVDNAGRIFDKTVARHRNTTAKIVHETFGQGRMFSGKEAISRGMADRIGTLESEIDRLINAQRLRRGRKIENQRQRLKLLAQK